MPSSFPAKFDIGHDKFFRSRLLILPPESIAKYLEQMETENKEIKQEAIKMSWYMRGGLGYDQALQLSLAERTIINELIKDNLDTTKKSGLPFF